MCIFNVARLSYCYSIMFQKIPGVRAFYSAKDIPGKNTFAPVNFNLLLFLEEEPIFLSLDTEVQYFGQPVGMIVASTMDIANAATKHVEIQYERMGVKKQIIPSLSHWMQLGRPKEMYTTEELILNANASKKFEAVDQAHKIQGESLGWS